jgi:hypothetical protein
MRTYRKPKPKFTTVQNVPCWAATYFANADSSGLSDEDVSLCVKYEAKLEKEGLKLVCPVDGTRNEFCANPAFGKACDTEDWTAEVLPPDRIVFRKYWHAYDKCWTPIAFLPDVPTSRRDFVMSYEHTGQHSEASLDYYWDTKPCEPEVYAPLLKEMVTHFNYRPKIMKKLILRRDA